MTSLKNYWKKIRCFCGYHLWIHQSESVSFDLTGPNQNGRTYTKKMDINTRFCTNCYKKQIRNRFDMNIVYKDINTPLTKDQTRIKNLNTILNAED